MNISKECESAPINSVEERSGAVDDTGWDAQFCQTPDRGHVDVLLDLSEDNSLKEQDAFEFHSRTGWEEAIQGWGRSPPFGCSFQMQRRGKRVKPEDTDYHCLLCVDLKCSEISVSDTVCPCVLSGASSPELCCWTAEDPLKRNTPLYEELLERTTSCTSFASSSNKEPHTFSVLEKPSKQGMFGNKLQDGGKLCVLNRTVPVSAFSHNQASRCPLLKDKGCRNIPLIINSFAVLPPVKTSPSGYLRSRYLLKRGEAAPEPSPGDGMTPDAVPSEDVAPAAAEESGSVEGGEETRAALPDASTAEDSLHRSLTIKYWPSQQSNHLLSAFSMLIPKKCELPFSTLGDTLPRAVYPLGRHLRPQDDLGRPPPRNSGHRLYFGFKTKSLRQAEPQLPMLCGTRVPIPVSTQRLL